ncbi:MAG: LysR family transcriptional regulator [Anaerovoracaceae bacterium]|jgi:DNA-binding transcriptional LysR family regulator
MIEIYLLEQLAAVAACGSLSSAAQQLNITQPALTRSIRKLEGLFGFPLFTHMGNRIEINEEGKLAAAYAERILRLEKEMAERVRQQEKQKRLITIESCAPAPLTAIQRILLRRFPDVPLQSQMLAEEAQIIRDLDEGACQIAVLSRPLSESGYAAEKLFTEHLFLSVMPAHPAAAVKSVSFAGIDGETFLIQENLGIWGPLVRRSLPSSRFIQQKNPSDLDTLREHSSLPAFSTDTARRLYHPAETRRIEVPIIDDAAYITFYAVCRRRDAQRFGSLALSE